MSIADAEGLAPSPVVPWGDSGGSDGDIEPLAPVETGPRGTWSPVAEEGDDLLGVLQSARKLSFGGMDEG